MAGGSARDQMVAAMAACTGMRGFLRILARVVTAGLWWDRFVVARAIAFCATSAVAGGLELAGVLFRHAEDPTAFVFNAMIRGHSTGPTPSVAVRLFRRMLERGIYPDKFSFPFLLRACARSTPPGDSPREGEQHHGLLLKHGFGQDLHVQTSLLHMYASLGRISAAAQIFDEMPERGVVTWNAIISAYGKMSENPVGGLILFGRMARNNVEINDDTLVAALLCCAASGSLVNGKTVHGFMTRRRAGPWPVEVGSGLLHMYTKCGSLDCGKKVFDTMQTRDVSAWTAMIGGLAEHGRGAEALRLFEMMVATEGLKPDAVTFTSLLHACSHSGLVEEGLKHFREMASTHGVEPRVEHYGAIVDLLGRAGLPEEARRLVDSMPLVPNQVVRGSLLRTLLAADEEPSGGDEDLQGELCVEVSNAHARVGRWDKVERVRRAMAEMGIKKAPASSSVDVLDVRPPRRFLAGDTAEPLALAVCESLGAVITTEQAPSWPFSGALSGHLT